jgi:SAM-dependent methyltransferase
MLRASGFRFVALIGVLAGSVSAGPLSATQLGGRPAEEWAITLESGRRLGGLEIDEVVSRMELRSGDVVADVVAGTGIFSVSLARAVGPSGSVLAVEIDPGFLPMIDQKAQAGGVSNIRAVLGEYADPKLPRNDVDVIFFHDVLHHVEGRAAYIRETAKYVPNGSRIVVVDYHGGHPDAPHGDQPELQITLEEVRGWMDQAGLTMTREIDLFDDKFFVVFTKRN